MLIATKIYLGTFLTSSILFLSTCYFVGSYSTHLMIMASMTKKTETADETDANGKTAYYIEYEKVIDYTFDKI